ncbi:MAG: flagellar hook-basal body complex protein, partial [Myxococcota bacterium]
MSIMKSINTGLSGLNSNGRALGTVGDNIANANTVGFKASRANFSDVMASTMLGAGSGARVSSMQQMFGQGDLQTTGNAMDLAVNGSGFFQVNGQLGGEDGSFYTRAGQFVLDAEGFVSTPEGLRLQGYTVGADGAVSGTALGDLKLGDARLEPSATAGVAIDVNLDASAEVLADPWDPANP